MEPASGLLLIFGDRARLVEVVQNLLDNAVTFMGDPVEPQITIGQPGEAGNGKPILSMRDNGMGVDAQYHERVFGLFDMLDAHAEGSGVGLAIVPRSLHCHGGVDQGVTFFFTRANFMGYIHCRTKTMLSYVQCSHGVRPVQIIQGGMP